MSRYPPQENNESDLNDPLNELYPAWLIEQESTPYEENLMEIYLYLTNPEDQANVSRKIKIASRKYTISEKNELFRRISQRQVKVPKFSERQSVMKEVHDGHGHFGQDATWARLYSNYWWPQAYTEVKEYVKSCEPCQLYAYVPKKVPALGSVPINSLFERFAIDYVGPFPTSYKGNKYIIVAVEYFTKWPIAKAVESADSKTTTKFLYEEIFCAYGPPSHLLSDNGSHFVSQEVEDSVKFVNTKHQYSTPYHPQTNGRVEQVNGTIVRGIKKLAESNKKDWDELLPSVLYAYRTKAHHSIGISPYELLYGIAPRHPGQDMLQQIGAKLGMERSYYLLDRNLNIEDQEKKNPRVNKQITYHPVGSQVIKINHNKKDKLDSTYSKKIYTVLAHFDNNVYILANSSGIRLKRAVNGAKLKQFVQRKDSKTRLFKQ